MSYRGSSLLQKVTKWEKREKLARSSIYSENVFADGIIEIISVTLLLDTAVTRTIVNLFAVIANEEPDLISGKDVMNQYGLYSDFKK